MDNKHKLIDKVLDERNIFSSIFCMESYVFDKGLLDTEKPVLMFGKGQGSKETTATRMTARSLFGNVPTHF